MASALGFRGVATPDLAVGDLVVTHGMRCRIVEPVKASTAHDPALGVVWTLARVENLDEVRAAKVVPVSWLLDRVPGEACWMIQGNDLAFWTVES